MSEYTQGFCQDGAAILRDGQPMTIEEVLEGLRYSDALASHVEMIRTARHKDHVGPGFSPSGYVAELQCAIDHTPDVSLARLKAQCQAESLEVAAEDDWSAQDMLLRAAELRRQAEEAQ